MNATFTGVAVGLESERTGAVFTKVRATSDSDEDLDFFEWLVGGRWSSAERGTSRIGGQIVVGFTHGDLDGLRNSSSLVSVGAGVFTELPLGASASFFVFGGGRYYFDTTEPTTCNDGTASSSTGQGTCSHHGGIRHYNDYIGDGFATELSLGIRFYL